MFLNFCFTRSTDVCCVSKAVLAVLPRTHVEAAVVMYYEAAV